VEEVRGGFKGLEGPVAAPDGGLFFSDIPANITYKLEPNGTIAVWRENTNGANGLFLARDGRLLAAEGAGRRIVAVTPDKRAMPLATAFNGQPLRGPNDVIADSRGGIYFTDPAPRPAPDVAPKEPGNALPEPKGRGAHTRRPDPPAERADAEHRRKDSLRRRHGRGVRLRVRCRGRRPSIEQAPVREAHRVGEGLRRSAEPRGWHGDRRDGPALCLDRRRIRFDRAGKHLGIIGCRLWRGTSPLAAKTAARFTSRRSGRYIACRCWPKVLPAGRSKTSRPPDDGTRRSAAEVSLACIGERQQWWLSRRRWASSGLRGVIEAQAPPDGGRYRRHSCGLWRQPADVPGAGF
jgi:hypothetical protein